MRDFGNLDERHFLDRGKAFSHEQLGDDFVDIQRLHEHGGALGAFLLAALAFFLLGHDVDVPAGELGGEAHVLAAPADGERKLRLRHHDLDAVAVLVEHDLGDFGGRQRVDDEARRFRVPLDDVDLLALQFVDDGLHAGAAHTDARADGIDRGILRDHGDLGARARIAGDRLDLDDAVVDFRHFLREQLGHELGPGARQEDLRPALLAAHVVDVGANAIAEAHVFARDHFIAADDAFGFAEVDDDVAVLGALHGAVDDLADAVLVFAELAVALGLAHLLHDDLLGVLSGNAAEIQGRQRFGDEIAELGVGIALFGVFERDLRRIRSRPLRQRPARASAAFRRF